MIEKSAEPGEDSGAAEPYGRDSPGIVAMLKSRALRGDIPAARELAEIQAARRSSFQMPRIKTLAQVEAAHEQLLEAAINGHLTAGDAERLSRLLMAHGEAIKGRVLEQKLAFVEKQINEAPKKAEF